MRRTFPSSARLRRTAMTLAMLAVAVPAVVTLAAGSASAARPTCTTSTEDGGALLPSAANHNIDCSLRRGDRGDGVERLQATLVECHKASLVKDGVFGSKTETALRHAQSSAGVQDDGIYGPVTRRAIKHPFLGDSPCGRVG